MPPKQFNLGNGDVRYAIQKPDGDWVPIDGSISNAETIDAIQKSWPYVELEYDAGSLVAYAVLPKPTDGMVFEQATAENTECDC